MTDMTAFLQGHQPPEEAKPYDHSPEVQCRALIPRSGVHFERTPIITEKICDHLMEGKTVRAIGKMPGMPSEATIRRWVRDDLEFREAYVLAKEAYVESKLDENAELAQEAVAVADDGSRDFEPVENDDGSFTVREKKETIARSAQRIEARFRQIENNFRLIAKLAPRKYGDAAQIEAPEPVEKPRNGDDARVIDATVIPIDQHPLYDSVVAWGKVAREREAK